MTATKPTLASVRKLARSHYGPKADVRHNPKALTEAEKIAVREEYKVWRADRDRLKGELHALGDTLKPLREAARFVVDVDGVPDALAQLRTAVERAEQSADIREQIADLDKKINGPMRTHGSRYEAVVLSDMAGLGACVLHKCGADTLEQLVEKMAV